MYNQLLKDMLAEQIEPGEPGDCFRNAYRYIGEHGGDVVHGKITNAEGKEIDHAWVENGEQVIDPTAGTQTTKEEYYRIANAKPVARYTLRDLTRLLMKTRHYGPFERYEPGDYADKKKPTYAGFSGVGRHDESEEEDSNKNVRNRTLPVTMGLG